MDILYPRCAGLDVHKKSVVACCIAPDEAGQLQEQVRTFSTMTADLLELGDWLAQQGASHVAMESTGEYWKPVYNLLEGNFELLLVNAAHIKNVPGRKTDVKDAQWIAQLLQHGLLRASFVPEPAQRELRDLCRHRSNFVRERATLSNRVQKVLEGANIKLGSVASDVLGVSGRAMLRALSQGESDPQTLAGLAVGQLRNKHDQLVLALEGRVLGSHRFILGQLLSQIESLDEVIARFNEEIDKHCSPFEEAVTRLDTIPGLARATAQTIVSEMGADMSRFGSASRLAAWAGVCPGNHESAGKRLSGRSRRGNQILKSALIQAAWSAVKTKSYFNSQFRRLASRRGRKRAILAVAHSILVTAYHMIDRGEDYQDLGMDYFERRRPESRLKYLTGQLMQLGYEVSITARPQPAAA